MVYLKLIRRTTLAFGVLAAALAVDFVTKWLILNVVMVPPRTIEPATCSIASGRSVFLMKFGPADAAGLRWFTVNLPDQETLGEVRDRLSELQVPVKDIAGGFEVRDPSQNLVKVLAA